MIYVGNHMYILHSVWCSKCVWYLVPYRDISSDIRYLVYNFADRYIIDIRYLKHECISRSSATVRIRPITTRVGF